MKKYNVGDVILNGVYEILEVINNGGTADVYRVRHTTWEISAALKIPRGEVSAEEFKRECESWITLGAHPNIALCYLVTRVDGQLAALSEWALGGTLRGAVESGSLYKDKDSGELQSEILKIAAHMAAGLEYAHSRGIINKDVKPANILMSEDNIRITDFGVSNGTRAYAPPEQTRGEALTPAADIYSWAATVMEMYCGGHPWFGGNLALKKAESVLTNPNNPAAAPEEMISLLKECLAPEPAARPTAKEIHERIRELYQKLNGEGLPENILDIDLRTADIENNRAIACLETDEAEKAREHWEKALKLAPPHAESLYNSAISKDEIRFEALKDELRRAGVTETSNPEIFAELCRAGDCRLIRELGFKTREFPATVRIDYQNIYIDDYEKVNVIDIETGEHKEPLDKLPQAHYLNSVSVGGRTIWTSGDDLSRSVGDEYNGKTRCFKTVNSFDCGIDISPNGKYFAVSLYDEDNSAGEYENLIEVYRIPEPYECRLIPSKFPRANEIQRNKAEENELYDAMETLLSTGGVQAALPFLPALEFNPDKDVWRFAEVKQRLAKDCEKSEPTELAVVKLKTAPALPLACALSEDGGRIAFLTDNSRVMIFKRQRDILTLISETRIAADFTQALDAGAKMWFAFDDTYLVIKCETVNWDLYDPIDPGYSKIAESVFAIKTAAGEPTSKAKARLIAKQTAPPSAPEGLSLRSGYCDMSFSADGFFAVSYKPAVPISDYPYNLAPGEDGLPLLHIIDHTLHCGLTKTMKIQKENGI